MLIKSNVLTMGKRREEKAILIQARLSSKRFPGKVLKTAGDTPLIEYIYNRCLQSRVADKVMVLTSVDKSDDELFKFCKLKKIPVFRGSLNNVLRRYIDAAKKYKIGTVCRVCADSPFIDVVLIDKMFKIIEKRNFNYISVNKNKCIAGLDSEIVTLKALERSINNNPSKEELEHVTLYIKNNPGKFKAKLLNERLRPNFLTDISLTVDYWQDLVFYNKIMEHFDNRYNFSSLDIFNVLVKNRDLLDAYKKARTVCFLKKF